MGGSSPAHPSAPGEKPQRPRGCKLPFPYGCCLNLLQTQVWSPQPCAPDRFPGSKQKGQGAPGDPAGSQPALLKGDHNKPDLLLRTKFPITFQNSHRTPFCFFSFSFPPLFFKISAGTEVFPVTASELSAPTLVSSVYDTVAFLFLSLVLDIASIQLLV